MRPWSFYATILISFYARGSQTMDYLNLYYNFTTIFKQIFNNLVKILLVPLASVIQTQNNLKKVQHFFENNEIKNSIRIHNKDIFAGILEKLKDFQKGCQNILIAAANFQFFNFFRSVLDHWSVFKKLSS